MSDEQYSKLLVFIFFVIFIGILLSSNGREFSHRVCYDGTLSYSNNRGACSGHGGVRKTNYKKVKNELKFLDFFVACLWGFFLTPLIGVLFRVVSDIIKDNKPKNNNNYVKSSTDKSAKIAKPK